MAYRVKLEFQRGPKLYTWWLNAEQNRWELDESSATLYETKEDAERDAFGVTVYAKSLTGEVIVEEIENAG